PVKRPRTNRAESHRSIGCGLHRTSHSHPTGHHRVHRISRTRPLHSLPNNGAVPALLRHHSLPLSVPGPAGLHPLLDLLDRHGAVLITSPKLHKHFDEAFHTASPVTIFEVLVNLLRPKPRPHIMLLPSNCRRHPPPPHSQQSKPCRDLPYKNPPSPKKPFPQKPQQKFRTRHQRADPTDSHRQQDNRELSHPPSKRIPPAHKETEGPTILRTLFQHCRTG